MTDSTLNAASAANCPCPVRLLIHSTDATPALRRCRMTWMYGCAAQFDDIIPHEARKLLEDRVSTARRRLLTTSAPHKTPTKPHPTPHPKKKSPPPPPPSPPLSTATESASVRCGDQLHAGGTCLAIIPTAPDPGVPAQLLTCGGDYYGAPPSGKDQLQ